MEGEGQIAWSPNAAAYVREWQNGTHSKYVLSALKQIDEIGFAAVYEMHRARVWTGEIVFAHFSIRIRRHKTVLLLHWAQNYDKTFKCVANVCESILSIGFMFREKPFHCGALDFVIAIDV